MHQIRFQLGLHPRPGWGSDVIVVCGNIIISMLWGNTAYCTKLRGEEKFVMYSNKIKLVGLRKCPYYQYLTEW